MTTDEKPEKAPETQTDAGGEDKPRATRKIVRRSAATRDNPGFTVTEVGPDGKPIEPPAPPPVEAPAPAPAAAAAPTASPDAAAKPAAAPDAGAPRRDLPPGSRRFDARAPRPAPGAGPSRPRRDDRRGGGGGGGGGDYRPPAARPMGARPLPGGPRAPASEFGARRDGDQELVARPAGMRPVPGGPRYPAPERPQGEGGGGGGDDRPRRDDRGPPRDARPRHDGDRPRNDGPRPDGGAPQAARPARPAQARPPVPVAPPQPVAKKPKPVLIPLGALPAAKGGVQKSDKPALTAKEAMALRNKQNAGKGKPAAAPAKAEQPAATFDAATVSASADAAPGAIEKAGDASAALVDAWLGANNAAAIAAVLDLEATPAAAKNAARRALGILKARGVAVPERKNVMRLDDDREVLSVEATFLPPDASGTTSITITSRDRSGRFRIAEVICRQGVGVLQAGAGWLSGSELKEARKRTLDRMGYAPAPISVEYARHRIAQALADNAKSRHVLPLQFDRCKELVEPAPATPPVHPVADLEAAVTPERAAAATPASSSLHNEAEFRSWSADGAPLEEMLRNVGQRLGAAGAQDPEAVNAALKEEMEAATDRYFSPDARSGIADLMRDAAVSVRARAGDARAGEVLAVAKAIRDAGLITSPPREIPFLVAFFQKALGWLAARGGGQLRVPV